MDPYSTTYKSPKKIGRAPLVKLLPSNRKINRGEQTRLQLPESVAPKNDDLIVYTAGDFNLLKKPCVAVVGSRHATEMGLALARSVVTALVSRDVVIVSGLAFGVDFQAHTTAIELQGNTIAVLGTSLDMCYPSEHTSLQETICNEHLCLSQYPPKSLILRYNFPTRNRLMAAVSDATVIIEATDTSGTKHQAAECMKLNRQLFISRIIADSSLAWPKKYFGKPNVKIFTDAKEIIDQLGI